MKSHRVEPGECLSSIGHQHGFLAETLWTLADNAALAQSREDMNCLAPGDTVVIPDLRPRVVPVRTGSRHRFRLRTTPVRFRVRLTRGGDPRAHLPYRLVVDGREIAGTTDGDGRVEAWVSPLALRGELHIEEDTFPVQFRHLEPVSEIRGIQQRLANMRLYAGEAHGELDEATREALRRFQVQADVEPTGEPDADTLRALDARHGG